MMDHRLLQGMLIAACVLLVFAIVVTWGQISVYRGVAEPVAAAPAAAPSAPAPKPAAGLLQLAPSDSVGALHLAVQDVLSAPLLQPLLQQQGGLPPGAQDLGNVAMFILPGGSATEPPPMCAVAEIGPTLRPMLEQQLQAGATSTVEGLQARQSPDGKVWVAFTSDDKLIAAASEGALGRMARILNGQEQGGAGQAVVGLVNAHPDAALRGGVVVTEQMKADAPPFLAGATGVAFGVKVAADLQLDVLLRFAAADQAQSAADAMNADLAEQKQEMASQMQADPMAGAMMGPIAAVLDKVQITAQGTDVRIAATLTQQDVQAVAAMVPMLIMGAMMGGEAQVTPVPSM